MHIIQKTLILIGILLGGTSTFGGMAWADVLSGEFIFIKSVPKGALLYFDTTTKTSVPIESIVDQQNKEFSQQIVVGSQGSVITFQNSDTINHNIYANDQEHKVNFDVGLAPPGSSFQQSVTWKHGTAIRISCKIHPRMRAWLFSLDSPYYKTIKFEKKVKQISFQMLDLPENVSKFHVWIPSYQEITLDIKPRESQEIDLMRKGKLRGTLKITRS